MSYMIQYHLKYQICKKISRSMIKVLVYDFIDIFCKISLILDPYLKTLTLILDRATIHRNDSYHCDLQYLIYKVFYEILRDSIYIFWIWIFYIFNL